MEYESLILLDVIPQLVTVSASLATPNKWIPKLVAARPLPKLVMFSTAERHHVPASVLLCRVSILNEVQ